MPLPFTLWLASFTLWFACLVMVITFYEYRLVLIPSFYLPRFTHHMALHYISIKIIFAFECYRLIHSWLPINTLTELMHRFFNFIFLNYTYSFDFIGISGCLMYVFRRGQQPVPILLAMRRGRGINPSRTFWLGGGEGATDSELLARRGGRKAVKKTVNFWRGDRKGNRYFEN